MSPASAIAKQFVGKVVVEGGRTFLESGGIRVELVTDDPASIRELERLRGVPVRITGQQEGARILRARMVPLPESAAEIGPDPDLVELLPLAQNPPAPLKEALASVREHIVGIRPGYRLSGATAEPALVVLTRGLFTADQLHIPRTIGETRIDVQPADPQEQLQGPALLSYWTQLLTGAGEEAAEVAPAIKYQPPKDFHLDECKVHNILCHVGPDAGWKTLEPFLDATAERLTVAMYDFDAPQIVEAMVALGRKNDCQFQLILQEDKTEETEAVADLKKAWRARFAYTPALVHGPDRIFNNSFHTKVAVRDGNAFWLSSGNWSPHSQPIVPEGPQPTIYRLGNREWHVVIRDQQLAAIFEGFIRFDFDTAKAAEAGGEEAAEAPMPDLLVPESFFAEEEAAVVQPAPFEPQEFATSGEAVRVQPLMTPDNYPDAILELIEGAEESLWMQYAYIRGPKLSDKYMSLVKAVAKQMQSKNKDVRVIIDRRNEKPADIQALIALGWEPEKIRLQRTAVHNKGILIDSQIAVVGSQNWSPDGTQYNRDASLILRSPQIAKYFAKVFEFDWNNLAAPVSSVPEITPVIATEGVPTPRGMVRIPWNSWYQES